MERFFFNPLPFFPLFPWMEIVVIRFGKLGHVLCRRTSSKSPKMVINLRGRDKGEMNKGGRREARKFLIIRIVASFAREFISRSRKIVSFRDCEGKVSQV